MLQGSGPGNQTPPIETGQPGFMGNIGPIHQPGVSPKRFIDRSAFKQVKKARPIEKIGRPRGGTVDPGEFPMEIRSHPTLPIQRQFPTPHTERVDGSGRPEYPFPYRMFGPSRISQYRRSLTWMEKGKRRIGIEAGSCQAIGFPYGEDPVRVPQHVSQFLPQVRKPEP